MATPTACQSPGIRALQFARQSQPVAVDRMQDVHNQVDRGANRFEAMQPQRRAMMAHGLTLQPLLALHRESRANNNGLATFARIPTLSR